MEKKNTMDEQKAHSEMHFCELYRDVFFLITVLRCVLFNRDFSKKMAYFEF